jgi:hypothetical protein
MDICVSCSVPDCWHSYMHEAKDVIREYYQQSYITHITDKLLQKESHLLSKSPCLVTCRH